MGPRYGQVILVSGHPVLTAVNWSQHWCPICVHYQFSCASKLARKYGIEHWSRSSKTINWSAGSFQINHVTSMSWHMSPRYVMWCVCHGLKAPSLAFLPRFREEFIYCSRILSEWLLYLVRRYLYYTYHETQIKVFFFFFNIMLFIFHFGKELAPTLFHGFWSPKITTPESNDTRRK